MFSFSASLLQPKSFTMLISIPTLKPSTLIAKPKCKPYTTQQQTYPTQKSYPHTLKPHINPIKSQKDINTEEFYKKMKPTSVVVTSFFGDSSSRDELDYLDVSGTLVDEDGLILSRGSLVQDKLKDIVVSFSSGELYTATAKLVAFDSGKDLSLIRIIQEVDVSERKRFPFAQIGDPDTINDGTNVFSISNTCYQDFSFTHGKICSSSRVAFEVAKNIKLPNYIDKTTKLIQTTIPFGLGSVGGALFNSDGEIIGTLSFQNREGITFAVHGSEVISMMRASLGVK